MKTDELIDLLSRSASPVKRDAVPARTALVAIAGALTAFVILVAWLGVRPDLAEAASGRTYWMKTLYTFGIGVAGFTLVERLSRPGAKGRPGWFIAGVSATIIIGIAAYQLMLTPTEDMRAALMGSSWDKCPWRILVLALPGLAAVLLTMRRFAPTRPALAGMAAGLLTGGIAATVYGLHCQEVAAPFVAIWYSVGMLLSAFVGAVVGSRLLRW